MKECLAARFDFFMQFLINRFRIDFRLIQLSQIRFQSLHQWWSALVIDAIEILELWQQLWSWHYSICRAWNQIGQTNPEFDLVSPDF